MPADRPIAISVYPPHADGSTPTHETARAIRAETTVSELLDSLCDPVQAPRKELAPAWSPIAYKGARRLASEAESVCALVYDLDDGFDGPALQRSLVELRCRYAIHETWTPGRARLVLPLETDCTPSDYPSLWQTIADRLGIRPDPSGRDLARLFYVTTNPPEETRVCEQGGQDLLKQNISNVIDASRHNIPNVLENATPRVDVPDKTDGEEMGHKILDLAPLLSEIGNFSGNIERRDQLRAFVDGTLHLPPGTRENTLHPLLSTLATMRNAPRVSECEEMCRRVLARRQGAETQLEAWVEKALHSYERGLEHTRKVGRDAAEVEHFFKGDEDAAWKGRLKYSTTAKGEVKGLKPLESNVVAVLENDPAFKGHVRWNVLRQSIEITGGILKGEPEQSIVIPAAMWFQTSEYRCDASRDLIGACIEHVAFKHTYDPVREYLSSLPKWDGKPRLARILLRYAGARGAEDWIEIISKKFFIAAVARAMEPGCQVDNVLVLQGEQGGGKTSFVRVMGAGFHVETSLDLHNKDAVMTSAGNWLVELGELASLRKSDVESVRNFITRKEDQIRLPYGRAVMRMPRRCVFLGTTNSMQPLTDPEGNRRFWVVSVSVVNTAALERDRDQLWAEALHCYRTGEQWWLTQDEAVRAREEASVYEAEDVTANEVVAWLTSLPADKWPTYLTSNDIASKVLHKPISNLTPQDIMSIGRTLAGFKWPRVRRRVLGRACWAFEVPPRRVFLREDELDAAETMS